MKVGKSLLRFKGQALALISAHSPEILTGLGLAGLIGTVAITAKQSTKVERILKEARKKKGEELTIKETVEKTWKELIPIGLAAGATGACIIASHQVNASRRAALMAAYALAEENLSTYKKKVEEVVGKDTADQVSHAINMEKATVSSGAIFEQSGRGDVKCLDRFTGRTFYSSRNAIDAAVNATNAQIIADWSATLNEFYYNLGLEPVKVGDDLGWNSSNMLTIAYDAIEEGGDLVLVLDYEAYPEYRLL